MPKTLIFGGSGKVARLLTTVLTTSTPPHTVASVIRDTSQSESLQSLGAVPVVQSIEDSSVADLRALLERESPDYVVWSAGAGGGSPERTVAVDRDGAIRVMDALAAAEYTTSSGDQSPKRFVTVSAIDVRDREKYPAPSWYNDADILTSERVWGGIGTYMQAKFEADKELVVGNKTRKLRYTIVRPGSLSLEPAVGRVQAGRVGIAPKITREDVARVVAEVLRNEDTIGLAFNLVGPEESNEGLPIEEAVAKVAKEGDDAFEGFY